MRCVTVHGAVHNSVNVRLVDHTWCEAPHLWSMCSDKGCSLPSCLRCRQRSSGMVGQAPPRPVRVVAVVIWMLSKRADLGLCYVLSRQQRYDLGGLDVSVPAMVALLMASYLDEEEVQAQVLLALGALDNKHRVVADTFLMHSLLVEYMVQQSKKGIVIDLEQAIGKYIRLWACRPVAQVVERRLALLVWNRNARRRFGVNLRREWCLTVSAFRSPRELLPHEIRRKVTDTCCPCICLMLYALCVCH